MNQRPRLFCDFNGGVDEDAFGLNCRGTLDDLARLGATLERGMQFTFYDGDTDDDENQVLLLVDGEIGYLEP